jgi:membrane glycosyltransferase
MIPERPISSATEILSLSPAAEASTSRAGTARIFVFYSVAVLLTSIGSVLFADLLWRVGWSPARIVLLVLFSILLFLSSVGCVHGIYGFVLRRVGDRKDITTSDSHRNRSIAGTSTALVFPVYDEEPHRICESLRSVYKAIAETGEIEHFDFFILSDSRQLSTWIEEEECWFALTRELGGFGRIFYRRRAENVGRKSGNIRDFLKAWGRRYRYFIVFDADSVMSGATVLDLVRLMETHPTIGLIQTSPRIVNAHSAFARFQQFANRLYGPLFNAALAYWMQDGGNYWGHNAIIRTEPFMQLCDLPELPGRKPFGGQILSHDFVEAALLRKENWEVWFAGNLEGTYEENPPGIIENAQRDRRWCQGNLQHFMVLFARGFRGVSRMHLSLGIFGYLAGPLWLLFLITSTYLLWFSKDTGLSPVVVAAFTPYLHLNAAHHALLVFSFCMVTLLLPKFLSMADLVWDRDRRCAFGGMRRACGSAIVETFFSTLHAPIQMLFHTKFVVATLLGLEVRWNTQQRTASGTSWRDAWRQHWGHSLLGLGWGAFIWSIDPKVFWWFLPVCLGLMVSVPLSVFTSSDRLGNALRRAGLLLTPEETSPPSQLLQMRERLREKKRKFSRSDEALLAATRDPYLNAIHVSLLHEESLTAPQVGDGEALARKLLKGGASILNSTEQLLLAADADAMAWLHREYWLRGGRIHEPRPLNSSDQDPGQCIR